MLRDCRNRPLTPSLSKGIVMPTSMPPLIRSGCVYLRRDRMTSAFQRSRTKWWQLAPVSEYGWAPSACAICRRSTNRRGRRSSPSAALRPRYTAPSLATLDMSVDSSMPVSLHFSNRQRLPSWSWQSSMECEVSPAETERRTRRHSTYMTLLGSLMKSAYSSALRNWARAPVSAFEAARLGEGHVETLELAKDQLRAGPERQSLDSGVPLPLGSSCTADSDTGVSSLEADDTDADLLGGSLSSFFIRAHPPRRQLPVRHRQHVVGSLSGLPGRAADGRAGGPRHMGSEAG
mmetsp:Transcript_41445/g.131806  ORF Transcript_41445/g.131806 Transcript_41445/m.131806 type:complete len:290 (-) Transcript_41445:1187-2056(-)